MNERSAPADSALPSPSAVERQRASAMPIVVWTHGEDGQTTYLDATRTVGTSVGPATAPTDVARLVSPGTLTSALAKIRSERDPALARLGELERQRGAR